MELRKLPKVDRVVEAAELDDARRAIGAPALTRIVRGVVDDWRARIRAGEPAPALSEVVAEVGVRAEKRQRAHPVRVINATGVVLHTNLGRAPLPRASMDHLAAVAGGYLSLEYDLDAGNRSRRGAATEIALAELVGAEAALVTNNNAAAVLLALGALAAGRSVVVSRGELVEIGGGFRIPEVLARSGAKLVEVGTTNRTRVADYERAIDDTTACLLRVHPSNFKVTGFTERPPLEELCALARRRGLPVVKDLGGGLVVDANGPFAGLRGEPTVQRCLGAGVDLVCFSLDKLFGGPQGGVIVGARQWVDRLRTDPLARAVRVDKLVLAALEPVVAAHARGDAAAVPALALLGQSVDGLEARCRALIAAMGQVSGCSLEVVPSEAPVGGGTLAEEPLESRAVAIRGPSARRLEQMLRRGTPPVVARVADDAVLLDPRSVLSNEDAELVEALKRAVQAVTS